MAGVRVVQAPAGAPVGRHSTWFQSVAQMIVTKTAEITLLDIASYCVSNFSTCETSLDPKLDRTAYIEIDLDTLWN